MTDVHIHIDTDYPNADGIATLFARDMSPNASRTGTGADKAPASPLSPREEEALKLLRDLAREGKQRPQQPPLRPKSGNRYVSPQYAGSGAAFRAEAGEEYEPWAERARELAGYAGLNERKVQ